MASSSSLSIASSPVPTVAMDPVLNGHNSLRQSLSGKKLCGGATLRRSYSDNHLSCSLNRIRASKTLPTVQKTSSPRIFNLQLPSSIIPNLLRSFLFDPETSEGTNMTENPLMDSNEGDKEMEKSLENNVEEEDEEESNEGRKGAAKRANWIERLVEIQNNWKERQRNDNINGDRESGDLDCHGNGEDGGCDVVYSEEDNEGKIDIDSETFSRLLVRVSWPSAKLFSKLAFLSNMAYAIPQIKGEDLRRYHGLHFVTSSLEKKAETFEDKFGGDSICVPESVDFSNPAVSNSRKAKRSKKKRAVAYEISASAASYIHSYDKDILSPGSETKHKDDDDMASRVKENHQEDCDEGSSSPRVYKSEVAAHMAASTMTAVVAAGEKEKQEAAKDLQSIHSLPCEWFVCEDPGTYTRCFVIQGSDSRASWQANLLFEPTKFEGTEVLVHRGIYEAAKGIYEQFMPLILDHLNKYGHQAKLQFTGHSLGGSLSLLINLMLLTRKVVKPSALHPVVTFGSPFVFCGGEKILNDLGLDEDHVQCVIMHRDIVPRAFTCDYPAHVARVLKRLNGSFRSHPCLNKRNLLYSPMGKIFILQPDENSSPPHPLLPTGSALYALENTQFGVNKSTALKAFLNNPHPLETLSDLTAYGLEGSICRDHESSNYLKAVNGVIKQNTEIVVKKVRKQKCLLWLLLTSQSTHEWVQECIPENNRVELMSNG